MIWRSEVLKTSLRGACMVVEASCFMFTHVIEQSWGHFVQCKDLKVTGRR